MIFAGALALIPVALPAQSTRSGYGSIPYHTNGSGVTFRVWAPNATAVTVPGSFNGWSTTATPLVKEISNSVWNGVWSADVSAAAAGNQYKYYITSPGGSNFTTTNATSFYKQDPRGRKAVSASGNDIVYDPAAFNWTGDATNSTALNNLVIYELHIGTFGGFTSPDTYLQALGRIPYLKNLGVTAVEVMPIAEFPGTDNWGYSPSDIFAADNAAYGGPDGFKSFVLACHTNGLAVLLDVVHNHYGPTDLDLWNFDGWTGGGNQGGIYFYQQDGYCCTTYGSRPNFTTQQVRNFIQDSFTMWMSECHVDGFRWDTPGLMINSSAGTINDAITLITTINAMIHTNTSKISIAEDVSGDGFDGAWDTSFPNTITPQLATSQDSNRVMSTIAYAITNDTRFNVTAGFNRVAFLESHDVVGDLNSGERLVTAIDSAAPTNYYARKRSTLGAVLTFTCPGIPLFFQGQEMLENQAFDSALPVDWTKITTYSNIVQFYHDLIRVRRNLDGYTPGLKDTQCQMYVCDNVNNLLAYRRWQIGPTNQDVFVIAHFANTTLSNFSVTFPYAGTWYTHLNSDSTIYGSDYGNVGSTQVVASGSPPTASITIAPYSALILSRTPGTPPTLAITQTNGTATISWSSFYPGWVLDSSPSLGGNPSPWSQVPAVQIHTNASGVFMNSTASVNSTFYRLRNVP
jgi:1,4-alpha-glucan branching enzyme